MLELSDLVWLVIVGIWIIARILPRLFRSGSRAEPAPGPAREATAQPPAGSTISSGGWPAQADMGQERVVDIGPEPIEPK